MDNQKTIEIVSGLNKRSSSKKSDNETVTLTRKEFDEKVKEAVEEAAASVVDKAFRSFVRR